MARFENTPDLFGGPHGQGTSGNIDCQWCGHSYAGRETPSGEPNAFSETMGFTCFGNLQVCECCFEEIEHAVLSRMRDIVPWFIRILQKRQELLEHDQRMIHELREHLKRLENSPATA